MLAGRLAAAGAVVRPPGRPAPAARRLLHLQPRRVSSHAFGSLDGALTSAEVSKRRGNYTAFVSPRELPFPRPTRLAAPVSPCVNALRRLRPRAGPPGRLGGSGRWRRRLARTPNANRAGSRGCGAAAAAALGASGAAGAAPAARRHGATAGLRGPRSWQLGRQRRGVGLCCATCRGACRPAAAAAHRASHRLPQRGNHGGGGAPAAHAHGRRRGLGAQNAGAGAHREQRAGHALPGGAGAL